MRDFQFVKGKGLYEKDVLISEFDVKVIKIICYRTIDQSGNISENTEYVISAITQDGDELPFKCVKNLRMISYFELWPQIPDAGLTNKERRALEVRLQMTAATANTEYKIILNEPGIYELEKHHHVYAVGDVTVSEANSEVNSENIVLDMPQIRWKTELDYSYDIEKCMNNYISVSPRCSEIICFGILLGAIKPFFIATGINPQICINLYGDSGKYKSSIVKAMLLAKPKETLVGSLINDKKRDILKRIKSTYGSTFLLDDYHPASTGYDKERQLSLIDAAVRFIETDPYSACTIITSEFLGGCYSMQDRILQVQVQDTNLNILSDIQQNGDGLLYVASKFVEALMENYDEVVKNISTYAFNLRQKRKNGSMRAVQNADMLRIVAILFEKYMCKEDTTLVFQEKLNCALDFQLQKQQEHMERIKKSGNTEEDDIINAIYTIIRRGDYIICSEMGPAYEMQRNQIFLKDNNRYYITKVALAYGLEKYLKQKVDIRKIVKILSDNDLLSEDGDAKTKKFNGVRHLCISKIALDNFHMSYLEEEKS